MPFERTNAVRRTEKFLLDLCNPKVTPKIPKEIRKRASSLLKHYPTAFEMELISEREDNYAHRTTFQIFGKNIFETKNDS